MHTGVIPDVAPHPLPRWLAHGVRACLCTDNPLPSAVGIRNRHEKPFGLSRVWRVVHGGDEVPPDVGTRQAPLFGRCAGGRP